MQLTASPTVFLAFNVRKRNSLILRRPAFSLNRHCEVGRTKDAIRRLLCADARKVQLWPQQDGHWCGVTIVR